MSNLLNTVAEHWWTWQFAMLWQTAVLIGIIWIVDIIIRKWAHPQVRYALWMLVLVKLLIPPTWTSPASITSHIQPLAQKVVESQKLPKQPTQVTPEQAKQIAQEYGLEKLPPAPMVLGQPSQSTVPTITEDGTYLPPVALEELNKRASSPPLTPEKAISTAQRQSEISFVHLSWKAYTLFVWLAGIVLLTSWLIIRLSGLRREHNAGWHGFSPEAKAVDKPRGLSEHFYTQLQAVAAKLGLKRIPQVILTDKVACPAVFGVFKPVLLMPAKKFKNMSQQDTEHILLHELAHIKRGDLLVHAVWMLVQIVYWFNPLLWIIRRTLQNLRELCCDATVARLLREKTVHYRATLLETARQLLAEPVDPGLGLLGLFENNNWLVTRLQWLEKNTWKNRPLRIAAIVVLVAVMATCVLPMANRQKPENTTTNISEDNYCLLVLEDCDPDFKGKDKYEDKLYLLDDEFKIKGTLSGFNICQTIGGSNKLAVDTKRKTLWMVENVGDRLWHIDLKTGEVLHVVDNLEATAVAIDPKSGNAWVLTSDGAIYGKDLVVFNPKGKNIANYNVHGQDIVYSKKDDCFWVVSKTVSKIDKEGNILGEISGHIPWCAVSVDIDENTGNAWVVVRAHSQVKDSKDEIWIVNPKVEIIKKISIDEMLPLCISVDSDNNVVWVGCVATTLRFTTEGEKLTSARQCMGRSVVHGFTKDDVFAADQEKYVQHAVILEDQTLGINRHSDQFNRGRKWLAFIPFSNAKLKDSKEIRPSQEPTQNLTAPDDTIVERTLYFRGIFDHDFFDFQTNTVYTLPGDVKFWDLPQWMAERGIDTSCIVSENGPTLSGNGRISGSFGNYGGNLCKFVSTDLGMDSSMSDLENAWTKSESMETIEHGGWDKLPRRFFFRSRDGDSGILEILKLDEAEKSITFRYKLFNAKQAPQVRTQRAMRLLARDINTHIQQSNEPYQFKDASGSSVIYNLTVKSCSENLTESNTCVLEGPIRLVQTFTQSTGISDITTEYTSENGWIEVVNTDQSLQVELRLEYPVWKQKGNTGKALTKYANKIQYPPSLLASLNNELPIETMNTTDTQNPAISITKGTKAWNGSDTGEASSDPSLQLSEKTVMPVAYWSFDGNANDTIGENDGTVYGAVLTEGVSGQGYYFEGDGDCISIPDSPEFDFGDGDCSVSLWFKTGYPIHHFLMNFRQNDNNPHIELYVYQHLGTHLAPGNTRVEYPEAGVLDDKWHHVVATLQNGVKDGYKLYLDGMEVGKTTYVGKLQDWDTITIGGTNKDGNDSFKGAIDEVGVYRKALSATEVKRLYEKFNNTEQTAESSLTKGQNGLISYWDFEGNAVDKIGGIRGKTNGAVLVNEGVRGKCYYFEGDGDCISIPDSPIFDFGDDDFTISAWFRTSVNKTPFPFIVNFRQDDNNPHIELYASSNIGTHLVPGDIRIEYPDAGINDDHWHHLAIAVENGKEDGYRFYLDGLLVGQTTYQGSLKDWNTITIGALRKDGNDQFAFKGFIDEVAVYRSALSSEAIKDIYQSIQTASRRAGIKTEVEVSVNDRQSTKNEETKAWNGSDTMEASLTPSPEDSGINADNPSIHKGMEFLAGIPEFRDLHLGITEDELQQHIERYSLHVKRTEWKDRPDYHLLAESGENVVVMFDSNGECGGIQRMMPIPKAFLAETIAEFSTEWKELTLPDVDKAPVMLDLASGELVNVPEYKGGAENWLAAIDNLDRGDLFFDDDKSAGLTFLRGANCDKSIPHPEGLPVFIYKISANEHLPETITVTTGHGGQYTLEILSVNNQGCKIRFKPLRPDGEPEIKIENGNRTTPDNSIEQFSLFVIPFEITKQNFSEDDWIEITQVSGADSRLKIGQTYTIKGRYNLSSCDRAMLHVYATNGQVQSEQGPSVKHGSGEFTRKFTYLKEGWLHLSFYPAEGGSSFGNLYFAEQNSNQRVPEISQITSSVNPSAPSAQPSGVKKIVLPDCDQAKVIFDLVNDEFIQLPPKIDSDDKASAYLEKIGRGDVIYDYSPNTFRIGFFKAAFLDRDSETEVNFALAGFKPENLPDEGTVRLRNGAKYHIKILSANEQQCEIEYTCVEKEAENGICPGDVVSVSVYELLKRGEHTVMERTVSEDGLITLHGLSAPIHAQGLTVEELRNAITQRYKSENVLKAPFVEVRFVTAPKGR